MLVQESLNFARINLGVYIIQHTDAHASIRGHGRADDRPFE